MEHAATASACPASPVDPQPDRPEETVPPRTVPERIAALLHTVRIMLGFGRHLAETAKQRSATPEFNAIAVCFGTGRLFAIMAHLQRGILRATALENVLLGGRRGPRYRRRCTAQARDYGTDHAGRSAGRSAGRAADRATGRGAGRATGYASRAADRGARRAEEPAAVPPDRLDDPELFMPTLKELEAQVRRRPLGRTLVDICLDLAVVPGFCSSPFLNELLDSIRLRGGSIGVLMVEKMHREQAFCKEQDRKVGSNWDWQRLTQDAVRRMLGGLIGEGTDAASDLISERYAPAAAVATGPS